MVADNRSEALWTLLFGRVLISTTMKVIFKSGIPKSNRKVLLNL